MRPSREHLRHLAVAVALAGVATSCVSPDDPGVAIDDFEADLVFGLEEAPDPIAPANTQPIAAGVPAAFQAGPPIDVVSTATVQAPLQAQEFAPFRNPAADRLPPLRNLPGTGTGTNASACPTALPTAAARDVAESDISGPIREGVYEWKREGVQKKGDVEVPISGFERRVVRDVQPAPDTFDPDAYTFEVVQVLLDQPIVQVTTYLVKPNSSGQGEVVLGTPFPRFPRQGEPERGVSIIRFEQFDEDDNGLGSTDFNTGLLQLPLPVVPNESYQSVAVSRTGDTYVQDALVAGRARIDACGELIDGWRVTSTQTTSESPGSTVSFSYLVATQYGGMPVQEQISTTTEDGSTLDVVFTIAQVDPTPLEAP